MSGKETSRGLEPTQPDSASAPRPIDPATGQHEDYWVLSKEERAKGFVRPVRRTYVHEKCGTATIVSTAIAETYARDPKFYGGTFCCHCRAHFYVSEFIWDDGSKEKVGS